MRRQWLTGLIRDVHIASRGTYESRRVHAELTIGRGIQVSERLVAVLVSLAGIYGLPGPARVKRLRGIGTADDLVNRKFYRSPPNELWVTDITEHPTREGKVFCCAVMDTFSRKIIGWSIDTVQDSNLGGAVSVARQAFMHPRIGYVDNMKLADVGPQRVSDKTSWGARPGKPPADGLPDLLGGTPLLRMRRLFPGEGPQVFAKLESFNPGGSAKDRPASAMLTAALESGELRPGDTVVESSSGNLGVALAQLCRWHGLSFICVVDPRTNPDAIRVIEAFGGRVQMVKEQPRTGGGWLAARQLAVRELLAQNLRAWTPNQYGNPNNPAAHAEGTMQEILDSLGAAPAALFVATSTTGTLQGCQQRLDLVAADTRLIAVDAVGSVLFGGTEADRLLPGFGASVIPQLATTAQPSAVVRVDGLDCVIGCRRVARTEGILVGASAGGVVSALVKTLPTLADDDVVVLVMHDGGERYLDTVFNDSWVEAELGCGRDLLEARVEGAARVA